MSVGVVHLKTRELHGTATIRSFPRRDGVADQQIAVDHDLISVRSHLTFASGGLMVVHGSSTARRKLVLHVRDEVPALALHITLRGTAQPQPDGQPAGAPMRGGEWVVLGGHDGHDVTMEGGVVNEGLRVNFSRDCLDALLQRHPELADGEMGRLLTGQDPGVYRAEPLPLAALADLTQELRQSDQYGNLRRLFLESTVLGLLARVSSGRRIEAGRALIGLARDRMLEARARLLASMRTPPTLSELARQVGTNEFRLKRDFKTLFGEPVHAFLLRRRLDHARTLLLDRDRSVKEIAAEVGYAHVSHFSAAFRRRFGVPPTALRR